MGISIILDEKTVIKDILSRTLYEDLGDKGDITSEAIFTDADHAKSVIKSKASGILSGAYLLEPLFGLVDKNISVEIKSHDGDLLEPSKVICVLEGPVKGILAAERTALNFLQRLSGIATSTSKLVKEISHTNAKLLDTRKTTPSLRLLEKKAVIHGGGCNHRFGLFDMILIKDTHVKRAGGVVNALKKAFDYRGADKSLKIEVEVQAIGEFVEALNLMPERIMLDNMRIQDMHECVMLKNERNASVELEASGNVTIDSIKAIAETGVDYISSGAITHSAPSLDIHLVII
jgi:nicotinate-nucleotide pyrophosphorylase (carboxylating)